MTALNASAITRRSGAFAAGYLLPHPILVRALPDVFVLIDTASSTATAVDSSQEPASRHRAALLVTQARVAGKTSCRLNRLASGAGARRHP
jgi:hypothetical protein